MEQWQLDALQALLETEEVTFVEANERAYISSEMYGKSRYHLVEQLYRRGIQIEQINSEEKWGSRVILQEDELPALLKVLLGWYMESQRPTENAPEESLGDLDDHPF
jgi:hypothetical protein